MTRKRYIKKYRYLLWRLNQLSCNKNNNHRDFYWSEWQKDVPTPSEMRCSYDEAWAKVLESVRTIEGMEDIE